MVPYKVVVLSTAVLTLCWATPPPGHVIKPDNDKDPPKYEFGYDVRDGKGSRQGHLETRDGVHALGMYYVNLPDGSGQSVRYFADDWGYHPLVSYSSSTSSGSSRTHFALGEKAVAELSKTKDSTKIAPVGLTASEVTSSALKLATGSSGIPKAGDILKIRPGTLSSLSEDGRKPSSSYQEVSQQPQEEQVDISAVNNLVDSNINGNGDTRYETATPVYTATQLISVTGSPSLAQADASNYDQNENTGSSSYQLVEIGSGSSGAGREISGSHQQEQAPLFLSQVSDSTNTESGKSSTGYRRRGKQRINIYLTNKNAGLQFGDRIPQSGSYSSQSNVEQEQNEIYKEEEQEEHVKVTPAPTPQKYSPLRPIIVAEIVSKEEEEEERQNTQTARPISVSSYPTPSTIHIAHSPKSSSTSYSSLADNSEQSNFFSNSVGSSEQSSSYSGSVDDSERSNSYSSSVEHSSFFSGSAGNHEESGSSASSDQSISYSGSEGNSGESNSYSGSVGSSEESNSYTGSVEQSEQSSSNHGTVGGYATEGISKPSENEEGGKLTQYQVTKKYYTSKPNSLSYSKETSYSSSSSEQSSADTNEQDNVPYAQPLVHTTPSPILVPYSQGSTYSSAESGSSQSIVTNNNGNSGQLVSVQHTSSPVYLIYSQTPNPLVHYSSPVGVLSGGYVSSTPTPILLSQSQESSSSYVSSGTEEHSNEQSVSAVSNGNSGQVIESEHSTPNSVYISHSPQASSFISNSQTADSVITSNNGNSGHIENSATVHPVYSTTARPTTTGYIVSSTPTPILIHSNPLPVPASVQSSASSGDVSHYQQVVSSTPQPPQVKEEIDDIPQPKTVVEVQKAISLDFNVLSANANQGTQKIQVASTPAVPISYNQQIVGAGQEDTSNTQHQLFTGNLIQYAYNQPVIELQAGYSNQPILQTGHLVYGYTPQIYEAQKVTAEIGNGQQQAANYIQIQGVKQDHQQQVTETEESVEKYQQLTTGQNDQTVQQQVITTYNQQSASGGHQILSQQELPQATNVQSGYNQQLIHTETLDYNPPPPPPTSVQQVHIIQPVDASHQVQLQLPVEYQLQQHINQHVGLQAPVIISQESGEYGGAVQSGFSQHIIQSSGVSQENSQSNVQTSDSNAPSTQSTNKQNLSYTKNPIEIVKQLQSEYKHQLAEEQEQEKAKLGVQIKEALKQIHSEVRPTPAVLPTPLPIENEYPQLHHYINIPSPNHELKINAPEKRPVAIEHTKFVQVEKPVPVHHTKIVEKPIPVPHAIPVEVTKLVAVDRPVPYPQPYAVPHPVPVPYAVPQPVGVPVPHIVPYPHVITVPYKDLASFHLHDKPHKYGEEVTYHYQVQNFPKGTPLPVILKALQYHGGRYGVPVSVKHHQHHSWRNPELLKSSDLQYLSPPPPLKPSGRVKTGQRSKYHDHFRSLCIEYGFKPPLKPSLQIDEIPASAYGPPQKED